MMLPHEVSEDVVSEGVVLLERFKSSKKQSKHNAETQSTQRKRATLFLSRSLAPFRNQFVNQGSAWLHILADEPLSPRKVAFQGDDA